MPIFVPKMARAISTKLSRTKGTRMKKPAASGAPSISQGLRRPKRLRVRSLAAPTQGCKNMLMMLSHTMINPITVADSPKSSRNGGTNELNSGQMMEMPRNPKPTVNVCRQFMKNTPLDERHKKKTMPAMIPAERRLGKQRGSRGAGGLRRR